MLIASVVMPVSGVRASDNGVDDLRGRWDIEAFFFNPEGGPGDSLPPLILYVNDMRASTVLANTYYAGGCMRSPDTNVFMPLSIRAVYDPANNSYDAIIYSTLVPPEGYGGAFVIRFSGTILVRGESVKDDSGGGMLITEFATGEWSAIHHDRRNTDCPSLQDLGLGTQADVYTHKDLGYATPQYFTIYESHTIIVSSGLLVEAPDGSQTIVQEYTDLFSPDVDFVGRFRYLTHFEGQPVSGGIYKFSLLDVYGDPIPGTESTDVWTGCSQTAPANLAASHEPGVSLLLDWDDVAGVPGEFEPASDPQIGFYQIGVSPFNFEGPTDFGSNGIKSSSHLIPWNPFEPGAAGTPDGSDFGVSLSELQDGGYLIDVAAYAEPSPQSGGWGLECAVYDSSERLILLKQGSELTVQRIGKIFGFVHDADGNPLEGIAVDTESGGYGTCTEENGFYILQNVPYGTYNIVAGREFCGEHPYQEQTLYDVQVNSTVVNFTLDLAPPQLEFTIIAQPDHEWVFSFGWAVGDLATIYLDNNEDPSDGFHASLSQTATPADWDASIGQVRFDNWAPVDLAPGMYVIVTDGVNTETLQVEAIAVDQLDETTNTVGGTAPGGREVVVGVHDSYENEYWMIITSNDDGTWDASFAEDIQNVADVHAMIWDGDGDATQANYNFP